MVLVGLIIGGAVSVASAIGLVACCIVSHECSMKELENEVKDGKD